MAKLEKLRCSSEDLSQIIRERLCEREKVMTVELRFARVND